MANIGVAKVMKLKAGRKEVVSFVDVYTARNKRVAITGAEAQALFILIIHNIKYRGNKR